MMTDHPNTHQNELATKLMAFQHAKAMEDAAVCVATAIKPFAEADRKGVLDMALGKLGSGLGVILPP
jgi:hypothetical protein